MKTFNSNIFLSLFCTLSIFDICHSSDNVYEQISSYVQESDTLDPNSLYYDYQLQTVEAPKDFEIDENNNDVVIRNIDNQQLHCKDNQYEVFTKRLINMLILKSNFKTKDGIASGKLDLAATVEELNIMKDFTEGKISIRQFDSIISNVIQPVPITLFDDVLSYTDILGFYMNKNKTILISIILSIFLIIIIHKIKWSRYRFLILICDIMIIITYIITYWDLLEQQQIKLMAQQRVHSMNPHVCDDGKFNYFGKIWLIVSHYTGFGKENCVEYFETLMVNPSLKVTPMHVITHMGSTFISYPFQIAAYHISISVKNYTDSIFWPLNIIVQISLLALMPICIFILIFLLFGGSMGFKAGPFVHLYLHGKQPAPSTTMDRNLLNDRERIEIMDSDRYEDNALPMIKSPKVTKKLASTEYTQLQYSEMDEIKWPQLEEYRKIIKKQMKNKIKNNQLKLVKNDILKRKVKQMLNELNKEKPLKIGSSEIE